jgi:hypothetical protein
LSDRTLKLRSFEEVWFGGYYLRFMVKDRSGLVGGIAEILGREGIGIREVLQVEHTQDEIREFLDCASGAAVAPGDEWKYLPFAMTVERAPVKSVLKAVRAIRERLEEDGVLGAEPVVIPLMEIPRVNGWQKRGDTEELEAWSNEAADQLRGEKLSVELFLNAEQRHIEAGKVSVKRIFLCSSETISDELRSVILEHQRKGVEVRVLEIASAEKYLRRVEDSLYVDFSLYPAQELGVVELAVRESDGRMRSADRGYQVYGSAEMEGYIRNFWSLWAFAESPRLG